MKKIEAKVIADSTDGRGNRITSFILTYPRIIHAELMTHRMFSRNSASSRAIPFDKMVKMVEEDPFIPIAWQKDHKGMQGTEYFPKKEKFPLENITNIVERKWLIAKDRAVEYAKELNSFEATKQICNRLLEPFMWHTVLVTATEWENFFELRCPKYLIGKFRSKKDAIKLANEVAPLNVAREDNILWWLNANSSQAEIHIQALAEAMWDAYNESTPKELYPGEWHIPFGDKIDLSELKGQWTSLSKLGKSESNIKTKVATARCARLSYMTFDGEIDYEKDIQLHDQLLESHHMSPFEHCAQCMSDEEYEAAICRFYSAKNGENESRGWCNNFRGFIPYRYLIENGKS